MKKFMKTSKKGRLGGAFTLIELIFVIVLVGILGFVGISFYHPDKVLSDTRFIRSKIAEARYLGIGYDHRRFGNTPESGGPGCVTLERSALEGDLSQAGSYRLHRGTSIRVRGAGNTICFDEKGRPHDGDFTLAKLLHETVDINVSNGRKSRLLRLFPISGYVIMTK